MILKKTIAGQWAKLKDDFSEGDILTIKDSGKEIEGEFGIQYVFEIEVPSGEKRNLSFNATSRRKLIEVYGEDTEQWIDKEVKVWVVKQAVQGKLRSVVYLTAPEQELGMEE